MQLICKVGTKRKPDDPAHDYDWQDGHIINIRPDGFYREANGVPKADMVCKHFCVMTINGDFWDIVGASSYAELKKQPTKAFLDLKEYTSVPHLSKYPWEDGYLLPDKLVKTREWFFDFDNAKTIGLITPSEFDSIMNKDTDHIPIVLDVSIDQILQHESVAVRSFAGHRPGSVASGTYTVGTSQTYADWSTAIADIADPLTGDLTFSGNTTEEIAESTLMTLDTETATHTLKLTVADAHTHIGGAYGSGHRVSLTAGDAFQMDETTGGDLDDCIIEKLAIDAAGAGNYGVVVADGGDSGHLIVDRVVVRGDVNASVGIYSGTDPGNVIIRNNAVYDFTKAPAHLAGVGIEVYDETGTPVVHVFNNTSFKNSIGIGDASATPNGTVTVKNNLCVDNTNGGTDRDYYDPNSGLDTRAKNISSDATGDVGYQNWAGTGNMVDYANDDVRFDLADTTADDGDDQSGIGAPEQFSIDMRGQTRSVWYIGCHEKFTAGSLVNVHGRLKTLVGGGLV
jgi:hypothetical protein